LLLGWAWLGRPFHPAWLWVPIVVTLLADWIENLVQLGQMDRYLTMGKEALQPDWIRIASAATALKLVFFYGSWLLLFYSVAAVLYTAFKPGR
jgi:hypothetical protein